MTPLGKSLIAISAIAIVVAGTLMLRPKPAQVVRAQMTPAQLAEVKPQPRAEEPGPAPAVGAVQTQSAPAPAKEPEDPDFEDGSGS